MPVPRPGQVLLETREFPAQPKTCVAIPPANEIVKLGCGEKVNVQVDAATTEHLGHIFVDLVGPEEKETVEEVVTYTDWSECGSSDVNRSTVTPACFKTRTKIVTTTKSYVCKETVVEVVKTEEKEACTCPCVETWVEQKPEITHGEWGECKKQTTADAFAASCEAEQCYKAREVTTVVKEQNSCTQEVREKSRKTTTEYQACECPVVKTCSNTPATSEAAQGFELSNSGDAAEVAWANLNVEAGPWKLQDKDEWGYGTCWNANISGGNTAKVALVKSGTRYQYYLNVQDGDRLCSWAPPGISKPKDISHITYLNCR
jgi:hypothetical protein